MDQLLELLGPLLAKLPTEIALILLVGLMIWRGRAEKVAPAPDMFREDTRVRLSDLERRMTRAEDDLGRLLDER